MSSKLWWFEKACWIGVVFSGGMLLWSYLDPSEVQFPRVVNCGTLEVGTETVIPFTVSNRTRREIEIIGGNFG
jgi:hypothetical protein